MFKIKKFFVYTIRYILIYLALFAFTAMFFSALETIIPANILVYVLLLTLLLNFYIAYKITKSTDVEDVKTNLNLINFHKKKINKNKQTNNEVLRIRKFNFPYDRKKYQILFERLEIAGINYKYENAKKVFKDDEKTYIVFEREPDNEYDKNAIAIYAVHENNKEHVGYVDKEKAKFIVENNLFDFVVPNMDYIAIGDKKIFQATYQILITKEKMKELRKKGVIKNRKSV